MPSPIIIIDSATGSDTAASGAGPGDGTTSGSAHTNSTGRTRNTASQLRFGLFGYTTSISDVLTDGSHVIYMNTSTAGQRKFSSIAGIKDTRQTVTGAITSGAAILTVTDSTGMGVGDVIKVVGAGAAGVDLYSTILTVDSGTQVTLNDNASTTVGPTATVENPRQVTLTSGEGVQQGTADCTWAIGGKRAALLSSSSANLLDNNSSNGDAMTGWIMEFQSGHTETRASTIVIRRAATICIRGKAGAATLPIITFSNNGNCFGSSSNGAGTTFFMNFEVRNTNATKTASWAFFGGANGFRTINIRCDHATDSFWRFGRNGPGGFHIEGCRIGNLANRCLYDEAQTFQSMSWSIRGSEIFNCGSHAVEIGCGQGSSSSGTIKDSIIRGSTGRGIYINDPSNSIGIGLTIEDSTIHGNSSHNVEIGGSGPSYSVYMRNNQLTGSTGGYGFSTGASASKQRIWCVDKCNTSGNSSGATTGLATGSDAFRTLGDNNPATDPSYVDSANGDMTVQAASSKGAAWPAIIGTYGQSDHYRDIGAVQSQGASGGSGGGSYASC